MTVMEIWDILDKLSLVAALAIAVWWFNKREQRAEKRSEEQQADRDADRRSRFEALERRAEACENDRKRLHEEVGALRVEVAEMKGLLRDRGHGSGS